MRSNRQITPLMERKILTQGSTVQRLMLQEYKLLNEEKTLANYALNEALRFKSMGYTNEEINEAIMSEGIMSTLMSAGGDGLVDAMKSYLINWLLRMVGLDPEQEGSWGLVGCAISNTIEELDMATFKNIFMKGTAGFSAEGLKGIWPQVCEDVTDLILRGVTECAVQTAERSDLMMRVYGALVGETTSADVEGNVLWKAGEEMIQNTVNDTSFMQSLRETIKGFLCNLDIAGMFSSVTDSLGSAASSIGKALGFDLSSFLGGGSPAPA